MPVIRVSEEVMEILKKFAIPLEDTPDSVLRRILQEYIRIKNEKNGKNDELSNTASFPKKSTPRGNLKQRYAQWIIASLKSLGGRARSREAIGKIEKLFGNEFSKQERELLKSGKPRWVKNINSARVEMVKQGVLNKTRYGIWELS
jgi:hypothetical protein